ncbi:MAG: HEAT repeat domain-containing protein [Microcoleaceae cyanobacterium]
MAPYHLILLLLTALTSLDWVDNLSQHPAAELTQLPGFVAVSRFTLAQETIPPTPETDSDNSNSDFPVGLILLGVGGVTITGGAVFILMRLLNRPAEEIDEDSDQPNISSLEQTDSTLIHPANSDPTHLSTPPLQQPFVNPTSTTPLDSVTPQHSPNPSIVEFPIHPNIAQNAHSNTPEPQDKPKSPQKSTADVAWVEDAPRYGKLDPIEQWILELRGSNPTHRSKAIWELGQQGDSRAVQPLAELLLSSDSKQRSLILASLSEISTRTLKPMNRALSLSLQDENAEVRKNAIRDLSRIYDLTTQMSQLLQRATDDPDAEVAETAHWAINKLARIRPSLPSQDNFEDRERRRH